MSKKVSDLTENQIFLLSEINNLETRITDLMGFLREEEGLNKSQMSVGEMRLQEGVMWLVRSFSDAK